MTERLPARGFGPGMPAEGLPVAVRIAGDRLIIEGWPGITWLQRSQLQLRRQGSGLLLEWTVAGEMRALVLAGGSPVASWLPVHTLAVDGSTRRWLWTVLLAVLGLPLLLLAGFFAFRGQVIDAIVARIPVEREIQVADELWRLQRLQLKTLEGTSANDFLNEVGGRLVAARPTPYRYRFVLADDRTVNAFAVPAGTVVVNRGLIDKAKTGEEVAGVLAHEIEHVEQRHSLRGMVQSLGLAAIWMSISGDMGGGMAVEAMKNLVALQFSREQETAADSGGLTRLVAAGIDPHGMASFFDSLAKEAGVTPGALSMLSTHPASEERAARMREALPMVPRQAALDKDWSKIQADLAKVR